MTWMDFVCLASFVGLVYLGKKRGVILEVTDFICIVVAGLFAFRSFRPIAASLHSSIFKSFGIGFLQKFCLFSVFTVCALAVFALGLNFRRRAKEEHLIEPTTDERLGILVGFFKASALILLLVGALFYNDAFPKREIKPLKSGPVVEKLLGLSDVVKPIVYITMPGDIADEFMTKGLGPPGYKPKKKRKRKKKKKKKKKK